jgi:DNA-binding MarR family transcriptional regulator
MGVAQSHRKSREKSLSGLFARANDALLMRFQDHLKSHGLSIIDWRVLKTLLFEDGMRVIDVAERALSRQVTITQAVRRMERSGLVRRRIPSNDRRARRVYLTDRGRQVARRLHALERRHERAADRALGSAASRKLKTALLRFIQSIEGAPLLRRAR